MRSQIELLCSCKVVKLLVEYIIATTRLNQRSVDNYVRVISGNNYVEMLNDKNFIDFFYV